MRRLDTLVARDFPGVSDVHAVFWSPDSAMMGFEAKTQLWKVAATGGVPEPICRVPQGFTLAGGATWLRDDRIVFRGRYDGHGRAAWLAEFAPSGQAER